MPSNQPWCHHPSFYTTSTARLFFVRLAHRFWTELASPCGNGINAVGIIFTAAAMPLPNLRWYLLCCCEFGMPRCDLSHAEMLLLSGWFTVWSHYWPLTLEHNSKLAFFPTRLKALILFFWSWSFILTMFCGKKALNLYFLMPDLTTLSENHPRMMN